ncbi:MAG: SAM-dependent methyltransferase [Lachnospiraceae bacterium]|nr:SAM-dependent methyltransferase [Lachnospiraceae bacterium]
MDVNEAIEKMAKALPERIILSKSAGEWRRCEIDRKDFGYQRALYTQKQVFHRNFKPEELVTELSELVPAEFTRVNAFTSDREYTLMISSKGKVNLSSHATQSSAQVTGHNRVKNYLIPEGEVIPALVDMGVFTKEGRVVNSMQDKFRQINRFVEMVSECIEPGTRQLNIVDFGCGKSYLTFILHYYLTAKLGISVNMTGLDLKADVIDKCNAAAKKYGCCGLEFKMGDIEGFKFPYQVDMVISLHACDTATDHAIYNAVQAGAKYILSVPCCQHELNSQIRTERLAAITRYGLVKERMAALMTDAIRGELLEYCGYRTQLLEFIEMEHTPKNILIRAVRRPDSRRDTQALSNVQAMMDEFSLRPTLYRLIAGAGFTPIGPKA